MAERKTEPRTLAKKMASIRRTVEPVAKRQAEGDDAFTYPPADRVFEAVRKRLQSQKVLARPVKSEVLQRGRTVQVVLTVRFVNEEPPGDSCEVQWPGEADDAVAAATSAYKGALLATFLIRTTEPDRHTQRSKDVRQAPAASPAQVRRLIPEVARRAGVSDDRVLELATDLLDLDVPISSLNVFPADRVNELTEAIQEAGRGA